MRVGHGEAGREGTEPGATLPLARFRSPLSPRQSCHATQQDLGRLWLLLDHAWTMYFGDGAGERAVP